MKMNGNMYNWIDKTWNPLAGKCEIDCKYCSTKSFIYSAQKEKYSGGYRLIESEFKNLGKGKNIFVCGQMDLFADNVPENFILRIINHTHSYPDNQYIFQSKNSLRMFEYSSKPHIYGTTIESNRNYGNISFAPSVWNRADGIYKIKKEQNCKVYVTIEPILDFDLREFVVMLRSIDPDWINIGADSKRHNLKEPSAKLIEQLICELKILTEIRIKKNLYRLIAKER